MSRVDELLAELAPGGVEFKALGEVTTKGRNIKWADSGIEEFQYIDLTSVDRVTGRITEAVAISRINAPSRAQQIVHTDDVIFATTRPTQMRWAKIPLEYDGQIASTGYCVMRPDTSCVLPGFLGHALGADAFRQFVESNQTTGNYPAISDSRIRAYRIPVPPLEVQREIVGILDRFTRLEAELEARRRQYIHWRTKALPDGSSALKMPICQLLQGISAGGNKVRFEVGEFPVYGSTGVIGRTDHPIYDEDAILIARVGANAGKVHVAHGKYDVSDNTLILKLKPNWDLRFAFHQLTGMNLNQYAVGGGQPLVTGKLVKSLDVRLPSVEEQVRIASILDKFDALVNDLSVGLPAELAARRKQYEYYRDRLLTFEEAV